jgi:outer membrane protein OmpA-like peptidoglycan-associated protein
MLHNTLVIALAAVALSAPLAAQERGTIEFGGFASAGTFDNAIGLKTGYGGGGRIGAFLTPRLSLEFEDAEMRATRPNGLRDVNVGLLSGRLTGVPFRSGKLSLLLGGGAGVSTETNFLHSYGVDVLGGAKVALSPNVALRLDGVWDFLANNSWRSYQSVRFGVTMYRNPWHRTETRYETREMASAPIMMRSGDSVSANEMRRLRARDARLRALQDSLRGHPQSTASETTARKIATMEAAIRFPFDKSTLTDSAKALLDSKIAVFRSDPTIMIVVVGYTDQVGTDAYNMSLGQRRAQATKTYIVDHGIEAGRVLIDSKGERSQIPNTPGIAGEAANRRAIFRLLLTDDAPDQR